MGKGASLDIKEFLKRIFSVDKPMREIDRITNQNLAALLRRKYLEEKYGITLSATGSSILDFVELEGKQSYKPIGAIQIPITIIGPVSIDAPHIKGEKIIPLASIYPSLMRAIELGQELLGKSRIRVRMKRCWIRIFSASTPSYPDPCRIVEEKMNEAGASGVRLLCYGRGGGHPINTVIIGEEAPCSTLHRIIETPLLGEILKKLTILDVPILTPYMAVDYDMSGEVSKAEIEKSGISMGRFLETYNAVEDLKPIDNSLNPVILGAISSLYTALGVKPEYGLRTEIRQYLLYTKFRKILVGISARVIVPTAINMAELSIINKELLGLLGTNGLTPLILSDLASVLILVTYTGLLGSIARFPGYQEPSG